MALPTVSVPKTLEVKEGSTLTIPLIKSGPGACYVQLKTSGISAKTVTDYVGYDTLPSIRFESGQSKATATLATIADDAAEPDETLAIYIANPAGCTIGNGKCIVTIVEASESPSNLPEIRLPPTLSVKEGEQISIPVTKVGDGPCSVQLRTSGITAKTLEDYIGFDTAPMVNFDSEQSEASTTLQIRSDDLPEADETLAIYATNPIGCTISQGKCTVTIVDMTPDLPHVSLPESLTVREGETLRIPVIKTGSGVCSVKLRTTGETAKTVLDYTGYEPYPTVTFDEAEEETEAFADLVTFTDKVLEGDERTIVTLIEPSGCIIDNGTCIVTINDTTDPNDPDVEKPPAEGPDPLTNRFPRYTGFATAAPCGIGKTIYRVTNLNDSGPGSLREAISGGNKLVVFEVAGCIRLKSNLIVDAGNLTIAGQTAPPPGITIQAKELHAKASNIRVQHIAFERGHDPTNLGNADVIKVSPGADSSRWSRSNIHFDHCSFCWGMDETVEIWPAGGKLENVSFTDCIIAEPLWRPQRLGFKPHEKVASGRQSEHNYGMIIGFNTRRVDVQGCLFADIYMRSPFVDHGTSTVIANNILSNVRMGVTVQQNSSPRPSQACVSNVQGILCISGPQSGDHTGFRFHSYPAQWPNGSAVYVSNLYGWRGSNASTTPGNKVTFRVGPPTSGGRPVLTNSPPIQPPGSRVTALSAEALFDRVTANCGPMPRAKKRNPNVVRMINKLKNKSGGWVDHESQVGGFSKYETVHRKLEDAVMPDGISIPVPNASDADAVKKWLDVHTSLVSND